MSAAARKNVATVVTKKAVKLPRSGSPINDVDVEERPTKRVKVTKAAIIQEDSQASLIANTMELNLTESEPSKAAKRAPKKKAATEPVPEDFPPRKGGNWKVGAHISGAGGIENAVVNAAKIGSAFSLYLRLQIAQFQHRHTIAGQNHSHYSSRIKGSGHLPI